MCHHEEFRAGKSVVVSKDDNTLKQKDDLGYRAHVKENHIKRTEVENFLVVGKEVEISFQSDEEV